MKKFLLMLCCALLPVAASADYPDRPIRLVVPFPAGSSSDLIARQVAAEMAKNLKQPIVVDNKVGAQTIIGVQDALRSPSDGYTLLLFGSTPGAINVSMYKKLPYDPVKDFTPIGLIGEAPLIMVSSPKLGASSIADVVKYGRDNDGKLSYGYGSTATQVAGDSFANLSGIRVLAVAYKGTPQSFTDLLSGTIDVSFFDYPFVLPHIRAGKVKALGVTTRDRFPQAPDIPAIHETLPGYELKVFWGLSGPGRLPPDVTKRLTSSLAIALKNEELLKKFAEQGLVVKPSTPEQFGDLVKSEIATWSRLIKAAGIQPQDY